MSLCIELIITKKEKIKEKILENTYKMANSLPSLTYLFKEDDLTDIERQNLEEVAKVGKN